MIRQFDFIFEFDRLRASDETRIDPLWAREWADKFIASFRANSSTNDAICVQINGDKIASGTRRYLAFLCF